MQIKGGINDDRKMGVYDVARKVPSNAIKKISGGAYGAAGLSDVNPQWRIERMTEIFGTIGDGWVWEPVEQWVENGVHYAHVVVQYKKADGEYSLPVHGYGGTKVGSKDDSDLLKSSFTDAISNALRYLGVGADVWYSAGKSVEQNQFDTKYSSPPAPMKTQTQKCQTEPKKNNTTKTEDDSKTPSNSSHRESVTSGDSINSIISVSQDELTHLIDDLIAGKSREEKAEIANKIKAVNNGSANYKNIPDYNIRNTLYEMFS